MKFFTKTLTSGTYTIVADDGATMLSIQPQSGSSCTFIGSQAFKGEDASEITVSNNNSLTISTSNPTFPIDGIVITWVSGSIDLIIGL
jgi:hypothetical protein